MIFNNENDISKQTIILLGEDNPNKYVKVEMDLKKQTMIFKVLNHNKNNKEKAAKTIEEAINIFGDTTQEIQLIQDNFDYFRACVIAKNQYKGNREQLGVEYDLKRKNFQFIVMALNIQDCYFNVFERGLKYYQDLIIKQREENVQKLYEKGYITYPRKTYPNKK